MIVKLWSLLLENVVYLFKLGHDGKLLASILFFKKKVKSLLMGVEYPNVAKFQSTWEHYYINVKIHTYGGHVPTSFRFPYASI